MAKLKKKLLNRYDKPVILINTPGSNREIYCLFDTGADTPVFTMGEHNLRLFFPGAELVQGKVYELNGFGTGTEVLPMYKIPDFRIVSDFGDERDGAVRDYIEFKELYIACCSRYAIGYPLILSATMFSHMNYTIYNVGKNERQMEITHGRKVYSTAIRVVATNSRQIHKMYSFVQS